MPAFNEARTIGKVVHSLKAQSRDVLVIDDGSTDRTAEEATRCGAEVIRLPINLGVGGALRAGFRIALARGYHCVVQVDGDGQHPVTQISELEVAAVSTASDLVIGSRFLSSDSSYPLSRHRRFATWILGTIASLFTGNKLTDTTSGFRLIREPLLGEFAKTFPAYYLGDTFEATLAAARSGYKVTEIPVAMTQRIYGTSSASWRKATLLVGKVVLVGLFRLHPRLTPRTETQTRIGQYQGM